MKSGSVAQKLQTAVSVAVSMEKATTEEQVTERYEIFKLGLADQNKLVQLNSILPFMFYGQATQAIPILSSAIKDVVARTSKLRRETISQLVAMTEMMFSESFNSLHRDAVVSGAFHHIPPDQVEYYAPAQQFLPAHQRWTTKNYLTLRTILQTVLDHPTLFTELDVKTARLSIEKNEDPFGPCVGALQ